MVVKLGKTRLYSKPLGLSKGAQFLQQRVHRLVLTKALAGKEMLDVFEYFKQMREFVDPGFSGR